MLLQDACVSRHWPNPALAKPGTGQCREGANPALASAGVKFPNWPARKAVNYTVGQCRGSAGLAPFSSPGQASAGRVACATAPPGESLRGGSAWLAHERARAMWTHGRMREKPSHHEVPRSRVAAVVAKGLPAAAIDAEPLPQLRLRQVGRQCEVCELCCQPDGRHAPSAQPGGAVGPAIKPTAALVR